MESKYICIHRNKHLLNISVFQIIRLTKWIILWSTIDDFSKNYLFYFFNEHYRRIMAFFGKSQIKRTANENIRTRLKKSMAQKDVDNNISVIYEINYNYARINNKGIILLPESLWIDTTQKIELLMIKLKNIDENGNKKIYFSRNDRSYLTLLPSTSWNSKAQEEYFSSTCSKVVWMPESISE